LTITTSSGGRGVRSRSRLVDESGEEGVKSPNDPNDPNDPNSGEIDAELQKSVWGIESNAHPEEEVGTFELFAFRLITTVNVGQPGSSKNFVAFH